MPDSAYARSLPADIRHGATGLPVIDAAVHTLYRTGTLHNHARMWLASYVIHLRKVHWRAGADWLYSHLLDGDLASNHLSWQWIAGTASHKPYLFNAANVARYAPSAWHSPGCLIDTSYSHLEQLARQTTVPESGAPGQTPLALDAEPPVKAEPGMACALTPPDAATVADQDVWLIHPWNLSPPPADLPARTRIVGVCVADFHRTWPWSARRWQFVGEGLSALTEHRW